MEDPEDPRNTIADFAPLDEQPNLPKPIPPAIQKLMDEMREDFPHPTGYERAHNRHNRS